MSHSSNQKLQVKLLKNISRCKYIFIILNKRVLERKKRVFFDFDQTKVFGEYIPKLFFLKITKKNILFAKINKIKKSQKNTLQKNISHNVILHFDRYLLNQSFTNHQSVVQGFPFWAQFPTV